MRKTHGTASDRVSEEAAFELGVVYSAVKDELVAFAAKEGSPYSFADVAARVAKLLQAEAVREQFRSPQYLPEMRQNGAGHHRGRPSQSGRYELAAEAALSAGAFADRPLKRRLSAKARKAISKAQRERWARYHMNKQARRETWKAGKRAQRAGTATRGKATSKQKSDTQKNYWGRMTQEERSAEMARRYEVRIAKGGKPSGGWLRKMNAAQRKEHSKVMKAAYARKRAKEAAKQNNNSAA